MPTVVISIRGDQLATYTSFSGSGNNQDREVTVNGVSVYGTSADELTVTIEQVNTGVTEFQNGQFVTITDALGNVVMPRTNINPDSEQGRAAGDEHLLITQANFLIDLGGFSSTTVVYTETDENAVVGVGDDDGQLDFTDFPCFTPGTIIDAAHGPVDVASLRVGDVLTTAGDGTAPITWIGRSILDLTHVDNNKKPLLFEAGSLGPDLPNTPLVVSPDHRILVQAKTQSLAPAKGLAKRTKVRTMRGKKQVEYISLFTNHHQIIFANGLAVETLYPGKEALKRLSPLARASLKAVCPSVDFDDLENSYPPACTLITKRQAEQLSSTQTAQLGFGRSDLAQTGSFERAG